MTEAELKAWMDAYTVAFNAQDSAAAAKLFSEDGTYQWGPFGELLVGPVAIRRAWDEHQDPAEVAEMTYEVLAVAPDVGGGALDRVAHERARRAALSLRRRVRDHAHGRGFVRLVP